MNIKFLVFGLSLFLLGACGSDGNNNSNTDDSSEAQYRVTFNSNWNGVDFPTQYPANAHFSGLIGTTHNDSVSFWSDGAMASAGVEQVAETGGKSVFRNEIESAQNDDNAEFLLDGSGIGSTPGSVTFEFSVNRDFSLVTLVSMVAPSPDWFVGVHDLNLIDTTVDDWYQTLSFDLKVYDAGTDSGFSFTSANAVTSPQENIGLLSSNPTDTDFVSGVQSGTMQHIGSFLFERIK